MMEIQSTNKSLMQRSKSEPVRESRAANLAEDLLSTDDLKSLQGNPESLLHTIGLFCQAEDFNTSDSSQYRATGKYLEKFQPDSVLLFGVEQDFGYSLIYLATLYRQECSLFTLHGFVNTTNLSSDNIKLIQYLVDLSGITQITLHFSNAPESFILDSKNSLHFDWVVIYHTPQHPALASLRAMESLSLVQPPVIVSTLNDANSDPDFLPYILGSPMLKRKFNEQHMAKRFGRWNLVYKLLGDPPKSATDPVFVRCTDILDS